MKEWITEEQLKQIRVRAKQIYKDFLADKSGEQSWDEIEIDGLYFDIECWDETGDERKETSCSVYPTQHTIRLDGGGFGKSNAEWRETDSDKSIRLFKNKEVEA